MFAQIRLQFMRALRDRLDDAGVPYGTGESGEHGPTDPPHVRSANISGTSVVDFSSSIANIEVTSVRATREISFL